MAVAGSELFGIGVGGRAGVQFPRDGRTCALRAAHAHGSARRRRRRRRRVAGPPSRGQCDQSPHQYRILYALHSANAARTPHFFLFFRLFFSLLFPPRTQVRVLLFRIFLVFPSTNTHTHTHPNTRHKHTYKYTHTYDEHAVGDETIRFFIFYFSRTRFSVLIARRFRDNGTKIPRFGPYSKKDRSKNRGLSADAIVVRVVATGAGQ